MHVSKMSAVTSSCYIVKYKATTESDWRDAIAQHKQKSINNENINEQQPEDVEIIYEPGADNGIKHQPIQAQPPIVSQETMHISSQNNKIENVNPNDINDSDSDDMEDMYDNKYSEQNNQIHTKTGGDTSKSNEVDNYPIQTEKGNTRGETKRRTRC